ncbi:DUF3316 domain-containing protein [uncultured Porphyromonas sp.]|uniref:DUF3316 domain-containing protein n=1 Tax=uncultured Porphyromonas sp. TaxID=159274 RepID=UPI00260614B3|nr:DUF3316 domain-containing protein [uncultured Porphyromonas sp.]
MRQRLRQILLALCVGLSLMGTSHSLSAQEADTTAATPYRLLYLSHEFRFGWNKLYNEYLSPLYYRGQSLGYRFSSEAPLTQSHPEWLVLQSTQLAYAQLLNPARTGATRHLAFDTKWSFVHQWRLPFGMVVGVGPGVLVEGATSYNGRNQNNPADQQLNGDLTAQALAAYRLRIGWFVADLRLQMTSALVGLGFAPYYNESYLQAYYYDKIINHFALHTFGRRHYYQIGVSLDIPIWRIMTLRMSYDYTDSARRIHSIYRSFSGHYLGVGLATYFRPFRGYQEVHNANHTTAISL